jgi:hypothetical protein
MKSAWIIKIIVAIVAFFGVGTTIIFLPIYGENDISLIKYFEERKEPGDELEEEIDPREIKAELEASYGKIRGIANNAGFSLYVDEEQVTR